MSDFSTWTRNNVSLFCLKTDRRIDAINLGCRGPCKSKGHAHAQRHDSTSPRKNVPLVASIISPHDRNSRDFLVEMVHQWISIFSFISVFLFELVQNLSLPLSYVHQGKFLDRSNSMTSTRFSFLVNFRILASPYELNFHARAGIYDTHGKYLSTNITKTWKGRMRRKLSTCANYERW